MAYLWGIDLLIGKKQGREHTRVGLGTAHMWTNGPHEMGRTNLHVLYNTRCMELVCLKE
jgi:hypothetical protein